MTDLQIKFNQALEAERANRAKEIETERSNRAKEYETHRSNLANEAFSDRKIKLDESYQPYRIENTEADTYYKTQSGHSKKQQARKTKSEWMANMTRALLPLADYFIQGSKV